MDRRSLLGLVLVLGVVPAAMAGLAGARSAQQAGNAQQRLGAAPHELLAARTTVDSLLQREEFAAALTLLRRAVLQNENDPYLWRTLGRTAARIGRHAEAIPALETARQLGTFSRSRLAVEIARAYAALDSTDAAIAWLEDALDDPLENRPALQSDDSFRSFHSDPRFRRVAGMLPAHRFDRVAGWQYDLDFFVAEAKRMHVAPHRPAFSPDFAAAARRLRERVAQLSDVEIYVGLEKLAVMLGDGHTGIAHQGVAGMTRLPIDLYSFSDGLFVVRQLEGGTTMTGHRVLALGSMTTAEALDAAAVFVPRDNPMSLLSGLSAALVTQPYLADLGITNDDGSVTLQMESRDGQRYDTTLIAGRMSLPPSPRRLTPPRGAPGSVPRYLRDNRTFYWLESLPEHRALYLNYNAVRNMRGQSHDAFAELLQHRLQNEGAENLIVDVRMNGGGNSFLFGRLLRVIIHFGQEKPEHRILVLTSRHTFSAAQNFINKIEQFTDAVFAGEPAGSRPNFTGESARTRLPYSGLMAFISTRNHYSSDWTDARIWIAPQVPVSLSSHDYFANRDPVFDAAIDLIEHGSRR